MSKDVETRFWPKVDRRGETECWLWKGAIGTEGYGQFRYQGTSQVAHRAAWMIYNNGEAIPPDMMVLHTCTNRLCVNPSHLRLGSAKENVGEDIHKERARYAARNADDNPELHSPFQFTIEPGPYDQQAYKWELKADMRLRNSDTVCFGGYGFKMVVRDGSLSVEYMGTNSRKMLLLNRGVHGIDTIVCYTHHGYISLDAIEWLVDQHITLYLINWRGEFLQVLSPRQNRNAKLVYLQYKAYETDLALNIAKEIVYHKVSQQDQVLRKLAGASINLEEVGDKLASIKDVETLRLAEAYFASVYWSYFAGIPIKWQSKDIKHIPAHWYSISPRISMISKYKNASQATNPFHAALNFAYALLEAQVLEAINIAGLAPECGYLHTDEEGTNSLAWDLMECFRPAVDTTVLDLFSKTTFHLGDFIQWHDGQCRLNDEYKRYVLATCRIDTKRIDVQVRWLRSLLESQ